MLSCCIALKSTVNSNNTHFCACKQATSPTNQTYRYSETKPVCCQLDGCVEIKIYTIWSGIQLGMIKKMRKWHFSLSETVSTNWQYILKRKANAHNTLKQKHRHYFLNKFKTLACTTMLNLDLQFSLTDHEFRTKVFCYKKITKKKHDQFQSLFSFCLLSDFKSLYCTPSV